MGSHPVPVYEKTINKNAEKRALEKERELRRNAAVTGNAAVKDIFRKPLAVEAQRPLMALLRIYQSEKNDLLAAERNNDNKLNSAERKRMRVVKIQIENIERGIAATNVLLGL